MASSAPNGKKDDTAAIAAEEPTALRNRRRVSSRGKSPRITADSITRRLSVSTSSDRGSSATATSCSAWLACLPQSQPAPRRTPGLNGLENADTLTSSRPVVGISRTSASSVPSAKGHRQTARQVLIRQGVHRNIRRWANRRKRRGGHRVGAPGHCLGAYPGFGASCAPKNTRRFVMKELVTKFIKVFSLAAGALAAVPVWAADYPVPKEADWVARDFRFHNGETLPEVRLHYTTVGAPSGEPVLVLHGTAGSGSTLLTKDFAGELFGPGQPLDASRYFIILPDALGTGKSTRPSDGLRARFPKYNYEDMVLAQYRLVTEGLSIKHLRLVLGNSMGGMQTWIWGVKYPEFMDALVPMACQPTEMSGRNWMLRRMLADAIRNDPDWKGGNYSAQPPGMRRILVQFGIATSGGSQAYYRQAPTREKADAIVAQRLAQPFRGDANDILYQWESSDDYNPSPGLERIRAALVAINAADDERNPPELGILEREIKRVKGGRYVLIPVSGDTRGHATTGNAALWKQHLADLLQRATRMAQ